MQSLTLKRRVLFSFIGFSISILIAMAIGEVGVRLYGTYDDDGNFFVRGRQTRPYRLPLSVVEETIGRYRGEGSKLLDYDPVLGWSPVPNGVSRDGLYHHNSAGLRSAPTEYSISPSTGTLRIALFGDSLTAGAEVPFEQTWGYFLQDNLKKSGIEAEVLNFGVIAYGMDQAFLRWKTLGFKFSPHIVLFGFQPENAKRNINLYRRFLYPTDGVVFTKPRFVLASDQLELINVPTVAPERVLEFVSHFDTWDLAAYEYYYDANDYEDHAWLKSKFVSTALELFSRLRRSRAISSEIYAIDGEPGKLAFTIVEEFKRDVEASGAEFLVVHLPIQNIGLEPLVNGDGLVYSELLERIKESNTVIDPADELVKQARMSSVDELFLSKHYSEKGNRVVADVVAGFLIERKNR